VKELLYLCNSPWFTQAATARLHKLHVELPIIKKAQHLIPRMVAHVKVPFCAQEVIGPLYAYTVAGIGALV
jgi:hypothetical protein